MRNLLCFVLAAWALPASACQDLGETNYDSLETMGSTDLSFGTANVTGVAFVTSDAGLTCMDVSYANGKAEVGDFPTVFSVKTCGDRMFLEDAQDYVNNPDLAVFGYQAGARVGLGLVKDDTEVSGYQYLIPSCWGPFSLRLNLEDQDSRKQANTAWKQWVDAMKQNL
ncbi:hypothetical protein J7443_17100 [Tropicibacter sp. R15_0]|uniref:hypothetical protein n=1 Tax=Tropicibacter sp. R15_0 TaxID=2821101 RepID=UPI001ADC4D8E|nr:hypothetical protein [Tropicibacter sp. R15_0]MBO9466965.1 hypothetical protein [Tropicibacter sp. R15_0]